MGAEKTAGVRSQTHRRGDAVTKARRTLALANDRLREIHARLADRAIEIKTESGAVSHYEAYIDEDTFRVLMRLSSGAGCDE